MTRQDYIAWAEEYRTQADIIERQIRQKQEKFSPKQRYTDYDGDKSLKMLYEMRNDCLYSMKILLEKAERMEKLFDGERVKKAD